MPRGRALRTLNVNPDTMQKSADLKTVNAAFSCTENDFTGNKCMLERSLKNAQLLKENKLVEQLEAQIMEQQVASTSKLDPSLNSPENSESANISETEDPDNDFLPTGLICGSSDTCGSLHTSTVENIPKASESLTSSSNNIVADLHKKLCNSHAQNKKRANGKRSQSSDTDDNVPLLNTIVNEILSLEADFPLPSTSFADTSNNRSTAGERKTYKRQYTRTAPKWNKKQRNMNKDLAASAPSALVDDNSTLVASTPGALVDDNTLAASAPSALVDNTPVVSDSDSDCEITGIIPSNSQQMNTLLEVHSRNDPELNVCDQSILELPHIPVLPVSEKNSEDASSYMRLDSLINMLSDTIERIDDDILVLHTGSYRAIEQTVVIENETNGNRRVIEIGTANVRSQLIPPVIVVSDDESEPSVKPALSKQLKPTASEVSSQQNAASSNGRTWQCPVCWEELTSVRGVYSTMCGHVFCNPCITHILKTIKKCPMCRKPLTKKKVHPLFLDG